MKLEIARGVFLVGALGVASLCAAAWSEPNAKVVARSDLSSHCSVPRVARASLSESRPDQDLLLLMYGLSQSLVGRS
ncbi:hypothetical protein [Stutzerimonas xanthomarina]|uniref:Uncharacterized protein n=2 Tax=Stutzerimonas xanthomarina TaxID=271420 RepID=A0A1M5SPV9_9GAMM|nr:hypothetical protein [Stutzerimonas xanthomarina]MCP9339000.1 hypothetical protein [Stutzerimonas xanthomarina]SEI02256.1 hypothetical protein SAMN05216535_3463 [Stutzerimonas xanthomarina]SHH40525.1 hypothetical protein SAMN02744645_3612 [Stutzerimonas xanthomarina DSM 18231]